MNIKGQLVSLSNILLAILIGSIMVAIVVYITQTVRIGIA